VGLFRPAGVIDITSSVRDDGTLVWWEAANYQSGSPGLQSPYRIPAGNQRTAFYPTRAPLTIGSIAPWPPPPIISRGKSTWTNWRGC